MKIKYKNRWYDVLDTREYLGSTFYAIEGKTSRIEWLKDTDVETKLTKREAEERKRQKRIDREHQLYLETTARYLPKLKI